MLSTAYVACGEELKRRILALIPDHPEILTLEDAWGLFGIPGFDCRDLDPTMGQASWAWSSACREHHQKSGRLAEEMLPGLIAEYANAVARHGPDSEEVRRIRICHPNNAEFLQYADALDRVKRRLGGSGTTIA